MRNQSLIGQIVACPRCDSMVQVEPPAEAAATLPPQPADPAPIQPTRISQTTASPAELSIASAVIEQEEIALPPEVPQVSPSIAKYKLLIWTLGAFTAGAALAGAVVLFRGDSNQTVQTAAAIPVQDKIESTTSPMVPIAETPRDFTSIEVTPITVDRTPIANPVVPAEEKQATAVEIPDEPTLDPKPQPTARVALRFDPLDFDPENLDLSTIQSAGNESASEPTNEAPLEADISQEKPLPSTLPNVRRDPDQTFSPAVAEEQLAQRFPALKVKQIPLGDFLALVSRLAAVPVSIAPEHLQMVGITARRSVSLDATDVDLNEALRAVLDPLHLEHLVEGPLVRVVRKESSKFRDVNYPLDDLASATSVTQIATWIEKLIAPTQWQAVGGAGTLREEPDALDIRQTQQIQYQVLIFLERYRLANGLAPRSRFPVKQLAAASAHSLLVARLKAPATFTFSRYTPLRDVVLYWQSELGVPILVDWPALAEVEAWPQTRIACSAIDKPWHDALNEILEPLGLGWRAVAGEMLEITTLQKVFTQPQLELYSLSRAPDAGADRLLAELAAIATTQSPDDAPLEGTALQFDSSANVVFVRQPDATQRKVYDWLVKNRLLLTD